MTQRHIQFVSGEFYHIYNRGNSKQDIFLDDQDKDRFIKLLYLSNSARNINFRDDIVLRGIDAFEYDRGEAIVSLGAWVLMSNHIHLLITIPHIKKPEPGSGLKEENEISHFIRKLLGSYTKYFNKKHDRIGGLFESRFKAELIDSDEYLKYIFSYIHLNPVKMIDSQWKERGIQDIEKAKDFMSKYEWSSHLDFLDDNRKSKAILNQTDFPEYFENKIIFQKEIFEWLSFRQENI